MILRIDNIYDLGRILRAKRKALGYSGHYVAKMVGVAYQTIYRGERGEWMPTMETLTAMMAY